MSGSSRMMNFGSGEATAPFLRGLVIPLGISKSPGVFVYQMVQRVRLVLGLCLFGATGYYVIFLLNEDSVRLFRVAQHRVRETMLFLDTELLRMIKVPFVSGSLHSFEIELKGSNIRNSLDKEGLIVVPDDSVYVEEIGLLGVNDNGKISPVFFKEFDFEIIN